MKRDARILIVDDESNITGALELILSEEGYEIKTASSVAQASGLLREFIFPS